MTEADFEPLLALSTRVLREDLERVGRWAPERRRARMRSAFDPAVLSVIEAGGREFGCIGIAPATDHVRLHSFCLQPEVQGRGLGSAVVPPSSPAIRSCRCGSRC